MYEEDDERASRTGIVRMRGLHVTGIYVGATVISSLREGLLPSKKLVRREREFFTSGLYQAINY